MNRGMGGRGRGAAAMGVVLLVVRCGGAGRPPPTDAGADRPDSPADLPADSTPADRRDGATGDAATDTAGPCLVTRTLSAGDSRAYTPLAVGDQWTYQGGSVLASTDIPYEFQRRRAVTGTTVTNGQSALVVQDFASDGNPNAVDFYYTVASGGLTELGGLGSNSAPTERGGAPPFAQVAFPVQVCSAFSQYSVISPLNGATFTSSAIERSLESHLVGSRTFADSLRVERIQVDSFPVDGGPPYVLQTVSTDWYAPGLGLIDSRVDSELNQRRYSYQLIGSRVGGVGRGVVPLGTLADVSSPAGGLTDRPAVASDSSRFLVVQTTVTMPSQGIFEAGLQLIFVGSDGQMASSRSLSVGRGGPAQPTVTYGDGHYLITFTNSGTVLRGLLVSSTDGTPVGAPFDIASDGHEAAVAFGQGLFMVANAQAGKLSVNTVNGQGTVAAAVQPYPSTTQLQRAPAIAFDGSNFLLVWQLPGTLAQPFLPSQIQAGRVNKNGAPLDAQATPVSPTGPSEEQASVVFDGTRYVIAWFHRSNNGVVSDGAIYTARVGVDGEILDPGGHSIAASQRGKTGIRMGLVGSQAVVVWYAGADVPGIGGLGLVAHLVATRLDANAMPLDTSASNEGTWVSIQAEGAGSELQLPEITAALDRSLLVYFDRAGEETMVRRMGRSLLFPW